VCPIETPEGPNIGLINSLALYARLNEYGFLRRPTARSSTAGSRRDRLPVRDRGRPLRDRAGQRDDGRVGKLTGDLVSVRKAGETELTGPENVQYMDVAPTQIVSVAASLIPSSSTTTRTAR